jgi:PST family polysaccharide transporter
MTIKVILMFVSFLLLAILVFSFDKFSKDWLVYFLTFGTVVGQVLFPIWFFQGMEQMKYITYLNILSKVIFTIAIFLFVQEQSDFYLVPLLTSVGFLVAGIWSLYLVKKEFGVWFELQTIDTIKHHLIEGWHVFVSRIYVNLYIGTNTILLGIFTNNTITGYYAIAEKIILAIGGIFEPFHQTMFPYLAKVYKKNISEFINLVKQISFYMMIVTFLTAIICYIWGEDIVYIITGTYNKEIVLLFSIFIFRLINMPFGSFYSNCLIIMHSNKYFIKVMNYTVAFYFLFVPISLWIFNIYIMTASFVFVLFLHVVLLRYYLTKSFQSIQKEDK